MLQLNVKKSLNNNNTDVVIVDAFEKVSESMYKLMKIGYMCESSTM